MVRPRVEASVNAAGFGPLVARCPHPNRAVNASAYWAWVALLAILPLSAVLLAITGRLADEGTTPQWGVILPLNAVAIALGVFLAVRAVGCVTRHAFYLYPQGYLVVAPSGRVGRAVKWEDVGRIDRFTFQFRIAIVGLEPRVSYKIHHAFDQPRPIKFTEPVGREVLGPLICKLHAEASRSAR
ncbi:hypothetical protein JOF56_002563 [Kibdelosporangium banguiense]|uniref:PH domain-containing protein n=1 Tax=Kibdelosporangium banguiense TaxID=1365924 RepID=A0ABS4TE87_9PSEU|nr:hypothetical protein [Kibdelosporangium banguiense]MBP2322178.1 hypothetical protein [Kibdelosporangium banguiense]